MTRPEVRYDKASNAAYIRFSAEEIADSAEVAPGIVLDYDSEGHIVGMEVMNAKTHLPPSLLAVAA